MSNDPGDDRSLRNSGGPDRGSMSVIGMLRQPSHSPASRWAVPCYSSEPFERCEDEKDLDSCADFARRVLFSGGSLRWYSRFDTRDSADYSQSGVNEPDCPNSNNYAAYAISQRAVQNIF